MADFELKSIIHIVFSFVSKSPVLYSTVTVGEIAVTKSKTPHLTHLPWTPTKKSKSVGLVEVNAEEVLLLLKIEVEVERDLSKSQAEVCPINS